MDKELQQQLENIQAEIKKLQLPWWRILTNGMLYGAGTLIGAAIIVTIAGYFAARNLDTISEHTTSFIGSMFDKAIENQKNRLPDFLNR